MLVFCIIWLGRGDSFENFEQTLPEEKKAKLSCNAHVICHEHNINTQNMMFNVFLINHTYQSQESLKCRYTVVRCSVGFAWFKIDNFSVQFHLHFPFTSGLSLLWPRIKKLTTAVCYRAVLNHLLGKFLTRMIGWDSSNLYPNEVLPDFFF